MQGHVFIILPVSCSSPGEKTIWGWWVIPVFAFFVFKLRPSAQLTLCNDGGLSKNPTALVPAQRFCVIHLGCGPWWFQCAAQVSTVSERVSFEAASPLTLLLLAAPGLEVVSPLVFQSLFISPLEMKQECVLCLTSLFCGLALLGHVYFWKMCFPHSKVLLYMIMYGGAW